MRGLAKECNSRDAYRNRRELLEEVIELRRKNRLLRIVSGVSIGLVIVGLWFLFS